MPTGGNVSPALLLSIRLVHKRLYSTLVFFLSFIACAKFTPKLHLFNQLGTDKEEFEIVFCSMDRSKEEYTQYSEKMPWWCLPYAITTLPKLAAIYHAHGMPHLVIIDTDGKVITRNGVDELTQDPTGAQFPWRPTRIVDLLPEDYIVVENEDDEVMCPMSDLDAKYLMLYFSSNTDSYSKDFTPWLIKAYNILKKKRPEDFEVRETLQCVLWVCSAAPISGLFISSCLAIVVALCQWRRVSSRILQILEPNVVRCHSI